MESAFFHQKASLLVWFNSCHNQTHSQPHPNGEIQKENYVC